MEVFKLVFFTYEQHQVWVCDICYARYQTQGQAEDCEAYGQPEFRFGVDKDEEKRVKLQKMIFDETKGTQITEIKAEVIERIIGHKHYPRYLIKLETGETINVSESFLVPA